MVLNELIPNLMPFTLFLVGLVLFVFALIGIHSVYREYKESKWQKEYGDKLEQETEHNRWRNTERLSDRAFLLEEIVKKHGNENSIDKIDKIISEVDYDERYETWKKVYSKWTFFTLSSMSGGLGSSEKAQAEVNEDFNEYEEKKKRQLREKLNKAIERNR